MPIALVPGDVRSSSIAINRRITAIRKAGEKLNIAIHDTMVMIAVHANAYRDCSGFTRLLNALPPGIKRSCSVMIACMSDYTPIVVDVSGNTFNARFAKKDSSKDKPFDIDGLAANPWYERKEAAKDPSIWSVMDIGDKLLKMAESIEKKVKKDEVVDADKATMLILAAKLRMFSKQEVPTIVPTNMASPAAPAEPVVMGQKADA